MKSHKITIGILAHVDAGKTTLSESILYQTGRIKKIGRVDHKDAYLDTYDIEKARGITIFSKQAIVSLGDYEVTLLDTPGHVDFSAEMERTLRVLDYAILLINATDGVQAHTLTVWKLLKRYHIPTFIFVNKMDLEGADRGDLIEELQKSVDENCIDFAQSDEAQWLDELAVCDELLMEQFIETNKIDVLEIKRAIIRRHVFPVYFGSALKNEGVKRFIEDLSCYMKPRSYPDIFGARVFKVVRNQQGDRLTYIKVTGGSLKVKTELTNRHQKNSQLTENESQEIWKEKVDQIRLYSGVDFEVCKEVEAGTICAVTGLFKTKPGDGLGFEQQGDAPVLVPVLSYKIIFAEGTNVYSMLKNLRLLEEEEPHLNVLWNERLSEIHVQVMGEIQIEILKSTILERFDAEVEFDKGNLVYRESIESAVVGVGHFEPLKHYAEVHLLLEPLKNASGMVFLADCSEDILARNWQRLILSHLNERKHKGVLTGSLITDMRVTLVTGRGHNKHTEGGDFREATFRALRQGLMKAKNILLEPVYEFVIEVPKEMMGKVLSDIDRMQGTCKDQKIDGEHAIIMGTAPVETMMHYASDLVVYSKGKGRLNLSLKGYEPCHNQEEVIDRIGYRPEEDNENPAGSVFCSKGVGYGVPWDEADGHMHMDSGICFQEKAQLTTSSTNNDVRSVRSSEVSEKELEAIFIKTYGEKKKRSIGTRSKTFNQPSKNLSGASSEAKISSGFKPHKSQSLKKAERYLLVDGYNIIFAWDELKVLAEDSLDAARSRLMTKLSNYQGQTDETVIVVFDAYRVAGNRGNSSKYHNIYVVYTKEAETADQYIEKLVYSISPQYEVTVATSDVVEQVIILGKGARKLSAEGFKAEMDHVEKAIKENYTGKTRGQKHRPFEKILKK